MVDLSRQHEPLADELMAAIRDVVKAQGFVLGAGVRAFEEAAAEYIGARHAIGVGNGTDALYLACRALDLGPGDEVVTTPFTFFATAGAIVNAGARPVFAEIDPTTFNVDPDAVTDAVTERTRAILPVHLFGQMAEMGPLLELADERGLAVIEDAAQAIGAKANVRGGWHSAGTVGTVGIFSFYPTKNLGGWGDGGLLTTNDEGLAERLRRLREHGQDRKLGEYQHGEVGVNSRLDGIQAAVLRVKLEHLSGWNEARRANAGWYDRELAGLSGITTPAAAVDRFHIYHHYTIRAERRDELREFLDERGIDTGIYYPRPLHLQTCFEGLDYGEGDLPEAERAAREALSLPVIPELTETERERVAEAIRRFYER
jgi:dTDP-4-amino-4,6-dideoxygalactose transaminase